MLTIPSLRLASRSVIVDDYGDVGPNIDSAPAINAAIVAAGQGGEVLFKPAIYGIAQPIQVLGRRIYRGSGMVSSSISSGTQGTVIRALPTFNSADTEWVQNYMMIGDAWWSGVRGGGDGWQHWTQIWNIVLDGNKNNGARVGGFKFYQLGEEFLLQHCRADRCSRSGMLLDGAHAVGLSLNCSFWHNNEGAIRAINNQGAKLRLWAISGDNNSPCHTYIEGGRVDILSLKNEARRLSTDYGPIAIGGRATGGSRSQVFIEGGNHNATSLIDQTVDPSSPAAGTSTVTGEGSDAVVTVLAYGPQHGRVTTSGSAGSVTVTGVGTYFTDAQYVVGQNIRVGGSAGQILTITAKTNATSITATVVSGAAQTTATIEIASSVTPTVECSTFGCNGLTKAVDDRVSNIQIPLQSGALDKVTYAPDGNATAESYVRAGQVLSGASTTIRSIPGGSAVLAMDLLSSATPAAVRATYKIRLMVQYSNTLLALQAADTNDNLFTLDNATMSGVYVWRFGETTAKRTIMGPPRMTGTQLETLCTGWAAQATPGTVNYFAAGALAWASNGRKTGEGAAAGTGCLVYLDAKSDLSTTTAVWRRVSDDVQLAY